MPVSELSKLTSFYGIGSGYAGFGNRHVAISEQSQRNVLGSIHCELAEHDATLESSTDFQARQKEILPPVCIVRNNQSVSFTVNIAHTDTADHWEWRVTTEQGETFSGALVVSESALPSNGASSEAGLPTRLAVLQRTFLEGLHHLQLFDERGQCRAEMKLIVAPAQCFRPKSLISGKKIFGLSVQLYSVRSERNWGIGDFSDLKRLVLESAPCGVDIIGVSPLHALFPANPLAFSPYSPSNRAFLNIFYIDPETVLEFATCAAARERFASAAFQNDLRAMRETDHVDYARVAQGKKIFFELLFDEFKQRHLNRGTSRDRAYRAYLGEQGEALRLHATYDALHEYFFSQSVEWWGWPVWPQAFRNPQSEAVLQFAQSHRDRIEYYQYLQWCATEQLQAVQSTAENCAMEVGLYLDLAVGVDPAGSEAWSNQALFCFDATVGAPADELAPEGQNWGFPPFRPCELRASGYDLFVKNIRANMRHAGAVRFDHCVALSRLWWVPKGKAAKDGAYVHYDLNELIGLLALESQRNHCLVIGEDLGTVPEELPAVMLANAMYCYRVLYFERSGDQIVPPEHYPEMAVATINTHDVAPLASWWSLSDIELRRDLNVIVGAEAIEQLCLDRARHKQLMLDALYQKGFIPKPLVAGEIPDLTRDLVDAIHLYLASSRAAIVISQLEDWQGMESAVNVPGTCDEYKNWQRKLEQPVEGFFDIADNANLARRINDARRAAFSCQDAGRS
ncbi:4-alpha-glucanotransferase [Marinobacterium rhizophilum]|uniref:4-alpha-glucanotransferase n=1 Tax=Marinobacterium rhizophilum TaxID=420402 RepID=UPI0003A207F2|nr:4-alpha-glucanotransferase [Marinobacterium rhizophilum]